MKHFIIILALIGLLSCDAFIRKTETGNGRMFSTEREVGEFEKIAVEGNIDVELSYSDDCMVEVAADENLHSYIETEVEDNKLVVKVEKGVRLESENPIVVKVLLPNLEELACLGSGGVTTSGKLRGSGAVKVESLGSSAISLRLRAPVVKATISGSANMDLSGETKEVKIKINGSGKVMAAKLKSETASVVINGSGRVDLYAENKLKSVINGSGNVNYAGDPEINSKINGSGKMNRLEQP